METDPPTGQCSWWQDVVTCAQAYIAQRRHRIFARMRTLVTGGAQMGATDRFLKFRSGVPQATVRHWSTVGTEHLFSGVTQRGVSSGCPPFAVPPER
jgi:hypothetical protein